MGYRRLEARGCARAEGAGWDRPASLPTGGSGVLWITTSPAPGNPALLGQGRGPSLGPTGSCRAQAHIPKLVEGDFTFVTITHLIGFQLNWRGSGGLCLCLFSSFLLLRIKETAGRVTNGLYPIWNNPPPVRGGQGCPGAGPTCRLLSGSHACISNQGLDSFKGPRGCWVPRREPSLLVGFTPTGGLSVDPGDRGQRGGGTAPRGAALSRQSGWGLRDGLSRPQACQLGSLGYL